jgi:1-acyl-sn-glycerol-3-phosphate acyltransferase
LKNACRKAENFGNAIYIANHQNNYDMVTAAIVLPPTVTVGKKPAVDPVFGQLYWLTGNLLIDRNNRAKRTAPLRSGESFKKQNLNLDVPGRDAQPRPRPARLKPVRFMPQLRQAFQLFLCAFQYIE